MTLSDLLEDFGRYGIPAVLAASFAVWCKPISTKGCSPGVRLGNAAIGWGLGWALFRGLQAVSETVSGIETMPTTPLIPAKSSGSPATGFDALFDAGAIDAELVNGNGTKKNAGPVPVATNEGR